MLLRHATPEREGDDGGNASGEGDSYREGGGQVGTRLCQIAWGLRELEVAGAGRGLRCAYESK